MKKLISNILLFFSAILFIISTIGGRVYHFFVCPELTEAQLLWVILPYLGMAIFLAVLGVFIQNDKL